MDANQMNGVATTNRPNNIANPPNTSSGNNPPKLKKMLITLIILFFITPKNDVMLVTNNTSSAIGPMNRSGEQIKNKTTLMMFHTDVVELLITPWMTNIPPAKQPMAMKSIVISRETIDKKPLIPERFIRIFDAFFIYKLL